MPRITNEERVGRLREMADFLEAHPQPDDYGDVSINFFCKTKEELAWRTAGAGERTKHFAYDFAYMRKNFGPSCYIDWNVRREQVCEKVVVGTETVELPAVEARPAQTVTREKTEWRCTEPMLSAAE